MAAIATMAQQPPTQISRTQIVIAPEHGAQTVKLFVLHELHSYGLLERCLGANHKLMGGGQVCRVARWSSVNGHIFNGRTEANGKRNPSAQGALQLPRFAILHDRRAGIELGEETPQRGKHESVPGLANTSAVDQWLDGTGESQTTPESRADIPVDAEQYLAASRSHTLSRARVPRGMVAIPVDDAAEETDSSTESGSEHDALNAMLPQIRSTPNAAGPSALAMTNYSGNNSRYSASAVLELRACDEVNQGRHSPKRSVDISLTRESSEQQAPSSAVSHKWDHDMTSAAYARVDRNGLTADATSTAQWANQNRVPIQSGKRSRNKPVARRATGGESVSPAHMSKSTCLASDVARKDDYGRSAVSHTASTIGADHKIRTLDELNETEDACSNKLHAPTSSTTGPLVSMQQSDQGSSPTKLEPDFGSGPSMLGQCPWKPSQEFQTGANAMDPEELHSQMCRPSLLSETNTQPVPQIRMSYAAAALLRRDSAAAPIVEEIQSPKPEESTKKYDTMGQRAGCGSKAKKCNNKMKLELPEPWPLPKNTPRQQNSGEAGQSGQMLSDRNAENRDDGASPQLRRLKPSTKITKENHPFGELLRSESLKQQAQEDDDDLGSKCSRLKLVGQAGVLLLRPGDKNEELSFAPQDPIALQAALRQTSPRTDFFSRLTTSTDDAAKLADIAGMGQSASTSKTTRPFLEILIRENATGQLLKVVVPAGEEGPDRSRYSVKTRERVLAEACLHYVVHVYDAQISLVQPGTEYEISPMGAMNDFIASINSDGGPPSFRMQVPSDVFTVHHVLAKRVVEIVHTERPGMTLTLSEVQVLVKAPLGLQSSSRWHKSSFGMFGRGYDRGAALLVGGLLGDA